MSVIYFLGPGATAEPEPEPEPGSDGIPVWALPFYTQSSGAEMSYSLLVPRRLDGLAEKLTAGDTRGKLLYQFKDAAGNPVAISEDDTVEFSMRNAVTAEVVITEEEGTVEYGPWGLVGFEFTDDIPVPESGEYEALFRVISSSGKKLTLPVGQVIPVSVQGGF
jgi:hypothetical protein